MFSLQEFNYVENIYTDCSIKITGSCQIANHEVRKCFTVLVVWDFL